MITLLDLLEISNLSSMNFLDWQYKDTRANLINDSAARCAISFGLELPTLFGRVERSTASGNLTSTHTLLSIDGYKIFNTPDGSSIKC